jgi:hypothetical protein
VRVAHLERMYPLSVLRKLFMQLVRNVAHLSLTLCFDQMSAL